MGLKPGLNCKCAVKGIGPYLLDLLHLNGVRVREPHIREINDVFDRQTDRWPDGFIIIGLYLSMAHCKKRKGYFNQIGLPQLHMVFVPQQLL